MTILHSAKFKHQWKRGKLSRKVKKAARKQGIYALPGKSEYVRNLQMAGMLGAERGRIISRKVSEIIMPIAEAFSHVVDMP
jgi:hypothetical protein